METQHQQSEKNATIDSSVSTSAVTRKSQTVIGTSSSTQSTSNVINTGINTGNCVNTTGTNNNITSNFLSNSINQQISSSSQPPSQQIIQISSQGGTLMSGQQLMVQTLPGRQAIQLRAQGGQQIQFIPFGSIQGQNQRQSVIIQQQAPGSVLHSASATAISSMANLPHNVAKIASVATNNLQSSGSHQKPVIIQQAGSSFLHSSGASHHNVAKLTTVNRTQTKPSQAKMINISTAGSSNHTGQNQIHHIATTTGSNSQQVTRLNIISSLPSGVHSNVSNVQQHGTKPIISLATTTLNKPLILNPAPNVVQPSIVGNVSSTSMHGVVNVANMGNFNTTQHQLKHSNVSTNIIPTVMTLTTLTTSGCSVPTRHNMITSTTSANYLQPQQTSQRLTVSSSTISTNQTGTIQQINSSSSIQNTLQSSSSNLQHTQKINQSQNPSASHSLYSTGTSTMRSNLLTPSSGSPLSSPIKHQISQQTPSSPRPSILIRKRVGTLIDENKNQSNNNNTSNNSNINNTVNNLNNSFLVKQNSNSNTSKTSSTISNSNLNTRNNDITNKTVNSVRKSDFQLSSKNENQNESTSKTVENNFEFSISSNLVLNNNYLNTDNRITPRKRRKQLLEPFTLTTSQNIKSLNTNDDNKLNNSYNEEFLKKQDSNGQNNNNQVNNLNNNGFICRRPKPSLLSTYNVPGKSLQCHFLRHCEVKLKPEKKTNLNDITSETIQKKNEWKVHHLSTQLQDILESEITFNQKFQTFLDLYDTNKNLLPSKVLEIGRKPFNTKIKHNSITILDKLSDLFSANIQRSNLFQEQIKETNTILIKLTNEHKEKVNKLTKRLINKRNYSNFRDKKTVG